MNTPKLLHPLASCYYNVTYQYVLYARVFHVHLSTCVCAYAFAATFNHVCNILSALTGDRLKEKKM